MRHYTTYSSRETKKLASEVGKKLLAARAQQGARVILLSGDLGSGKTVFVQGLLRSFGLSGRITSPTFVLMRQYKIPTGKKIVYNRAYHVDAYRLNKKTLHHALKKEALQDPRAVVLIEWPENVPGLIPKNAIKILFKHVDENTREIMYES